MHFAVLICECYVEFTCTTCEHYTHPHDLLILPRLHTHLEPK